MKRNYFLCLFTLCAILITGCSGQKTDVNNNDNAEATAENTAEPTEEPTEKPTEESTEEPVEEPMAEMTGEPTQEPAKKKTSAPSTKKPNSGKTKKVTLAQAKAIALKEAGISEKDGRWEKADEDRENGRMVYDLEFISGKQEYDFEIDVETGKVLEYKKESVDD